MGRQTGKKKKKQIELNPNLKKNGDQSNAGCDHDTSMFISLAQESRDEGNKLFQKRDYEGAMLKYEKALNLLPRNHVDVAYLRANMAECYIQLGDSEYPQAIHQCNLALEVVPDYRKALLKRGRCYEYMNKLELALRDVDLVLNLEPNNLMALEVSEKIKGRIKERSVSASDKVFGLPRHDKRKKKKKKKKDVEDKTKQIEERSVIMKETNLARQTQQEEREKEGIEDVEKVKVVDKPKKSVKLVLGEDIRRAQLPSNYTLLQLREVTKGLFPNLKAVLVKYKDEEGDLVTITTDEELSIAESSVNPPNSLRLYIVEVDPEQDLFYAALFDTKQPKGGGLHDDWIIHFARLFKNHVGFDGDGCLDLHEVGMKLYSEAMEDTVTCEEAQDLFDMAASKFQEMAALAFFNWGNVHMSRARKRVYSTGSELEKAYNWAVNEYIKSGKSYQEAIKIKPDFFEGFFALAQQQFEQARLSWYFAVGSDIDDIESWAFTEVLDHYNHAEENMEHGIKMWEETERKCIVDSGVRKGSASDSGDTHASMYAQINLLYGTMLYERSVVEFKLDLPSWNECLEVAVEKFELAGASHTDVAVMIKHHSSNSNAVGGLGFKIDEIVQAWNEMYEAKRWLSGGPSFRFEPLLRRRAPFIYQVLEHPSGSC